MASLRPRPRRRLGPRPRTLCYAACTFFASSAIASPASAEFALSWRGDAKTERCVTESALHEAVVRKLGWEPFGAQDGAEIVIEGVEKKIGADRFRARVTQRDRHGAVLGARELEAQSCASLLRAATLVVALIIDPEGTGPAETPVPAPPPPPEPPAPSAPPLRRKAPPLRPSPASPPRRLELMLGGGVGTTAGVLPNASVTVHALSRLETGSRWSFDWRGGYSISQRLRDGTVHGDFAAIEQQLRGCFAFVRWTHGTLDACGGFLWGAVLPTTAGVRQGNDSWRVLAGPTGAIALGLREGKATMRLDIGISLPFREYGFFYFSSTEERKRFYSTGSVLFFVSLSGLGSIS